MSITGRSEDHRCIRRVDEMKPNVPLDATLASSLTTTTESCESDLANERARLLVRRARAERKLAEAGNADGDERIMELATELAMIQSALDLLDQPPNDTPDD
jgi:hypothetical protein